MRHDQPDLAAGVRLAAIALVAALATATVVIGAGQALLDARTPGPESAAAERAPLVRAGFG